MKLKTLKNPISIIILIFILTGNIFSNDKKSEIELQTRFNRVLKLIQTQFVEEKDPEELIDGAIEGMLKSLKDSHSAYLKPKNYEDLKMETKGEYGGLGIVIGIRNNRLTVISPIEDTPAEKLGIEPGDQIIKIEGTNAIGISLHDAVNKLRGKAGTKVTITIYREDVEEPFDLTITRANIKIKSVKHEIINGTIGYLRITSFNENTHSELLKKLETLKSKDIDSLIIDLRNNPGGLLSVVIKAVNEFISEGLIVYTRGRIKFQNRDYFATRKTRCPDWPIVVIVNRGSASASEIFAGAIKDHHRGVIIGEKTFGKGSVQSVQELGDNYGIRLTTARYYTPNGTMIDKKGLEPDVEVKARRLTKSESKMLKKLRKGKYIKEFLNDYPEYKENDYKKFKNELQKEEIDIDDSLLKNEILLEKKKHEKPPLTNLELDNQLKTAVDILIAEKIVNERVSVTNQKTE